MSQNYYAKSDASSAGAVLAAAREELNLSVAEVARHLKLSPAQVEALEEGAYDRLPGRVFVRGFLRNYAKLLGVDPQPLLRRIEHELPQPAAVKESPPSPEEVMPTGERSRWPVYAGIAGVIIAALAAYEFGFNSPPSLSEENQPAAGPDSAAGLPPATAAAPVPGSTTPPEPAGAPAADASGPVTATTTAASSEPPPSATASAPPAEPARPPGTHELHFRFDEESWVEVRDANEKVIFTKLNRAGSEERVTGAAPLKVVVGNARGVRLTSDGEAVDLTPHTGVSVARLTVK
jgi:cytoskeleton protein RodZ